jgi:hypothetical protein
MTKQNQTIQIRETTTRDSPLVFRETIEIEKLNDNTIMIIQNNTTEINKTEILNKKQTIKRKHNIIVIEKEDLKRIWSEVK